MTENQAPNNIEASPYSSKPLPLVLAASGRLDGRLLLLIVIEMFLCGVSIWLFPMIVVTEQHGALIFILSVILVMAAGNAICIYQLGRESSRDLILRSDAMILGRKILPWHKLTAPAIEESELEGGGFEYRVTFCQIGEGVFGRWYSLNAAYYFTAPLSEARKAHILCDLLNDARHQATADPAVSTGDCVAIHSALRVRGPN